LTITGFGNKPGNYKIINSKTGKEEGLLASEMEPIYENYKLYLNYKDNSNTDVFSESTFKKSTFHTKWKVERKVATDSSCLLLPAFKHCSRKDYLLLLFAKNSEGTKEEMEEYKIGLINFIKKRLKLLTSLTPAVTGLKV
jgi:hypothetical protein